MTKPNLGNSAARDKALESLATMQVKPTALVEYRSNGKVLVIGDEQAMEFAPRLRAYDLQAEILLTSGGVEPGETVIPAGGRDIAVSGYMGEFVVTLGMQGSANYEALHSDLILDLGADPLLDMPVKPPGYLLADINNEASLFETLEQLRELKGTFEKPRYFDYDLNICAHGRSGQKGCTACIDACPTDAITSLAESIEVNPHLCQGGGVCAAVCPTGAIRYVYPNAADTIDRIRQVLLQYHQAGGEYPVIAFVSEEDFVQVQEWPSNMIPVVLEELASVGLDAWLSAIAFGASSVVLIEAGSVPLGVETALNDQLEVAKSLLEGMAYDPDVIQYLPITALQTLKLPCMPDIKIATYGGSNQKREMMFFALNHLARQTNQHVNEIIDLPAAAPFGRIEVDSDKCTLCMACTSVCPATALHAGNETPRLSFIEENCVQCGLCQSACPEQAIQLRPQFQTDRKQRCATVILNEESPFLCVSCQKPFATKSLIDTILGKLADHAMFQNERAKQRLMMCDECRVVDVIQDTDAMEGQGLRTGSRENQK